MLRALLLSLMNLALAGMATAQNLVANSGFEDTVHCELSGVYSLRKAAGWYSANTATPDLYDCDLTRQCGEPMDPDDIQGVVLQGYQDAHEGSRFAAGFQWYGPGVPTEQDTRDYCMSKLMAPLQAGQAYAVSLWCSRAEGYRYAVDHIGAYLAWDSVYAGSPTVLGVIPQARLRSASHTYLTEGDGWLQVADTIVASGGEEWIVIGTFEGSDAVNGTVASPGSIYQVAYYYFDQVEVRRVEGGNGIRELVAWYAGGNRVGLFWTGGTTNAGYTIVDSAGRIVAKGPLELASGTQMVVLPPALGPGVYFICAQSQSLRQVGRFIKGEGGD